MAFWYKYLPINYARQMVEDGKIKIGTLYGYRSIEKPASNIGDKDEGKLVKWSQDKEMKLGTELNELEKMVINAPGMMFANTSVDVTHESTDAYLYCVSRSFDVSMMTKMSKTYDACVKIADPALFVDEVKKVFCNKGTFLGFGDCIYMNRRQHYTVKAPHPAIIKGFRDKDQQETRLIWDPVSKESISSQIITVEGIRKCCALCYVKQKPE